MNRYREIPLLGDDSLRDLETNSIFFDEIQGTDGRYIELTRQTTRRNETLDKVCEYAVEFGRRYIKMWPTCCGQIRLRPSTES